MEKIPGNGGGPQPGGGITADMLKDAENVKCEKCEGETFQEVMMIKKISKFLTGSTQDSIAPLPVIACANCGHVNELFKPEI
jgi:uncharacterized Zn finger protein